MKKLYKKLYLKTKPPPLNGAAHWCFSELEMGSAFFLNYR